MGFQFFQGHVLDALGVTDDWYRECNETLSLVIAYGERGKRWECRHAVAACRDRAPPKSYHSSHGTGNSGGLTALLMLLREVHEEYCEMVRGRNEQGRASSSKIDLILFIHNKFNPFCRQIPLLPQLELHHFVRVDRNSPRQGPPTYSP